MTVREPDGQLPSRKQARKKQVKNYVHSDKMSLHDFHGIIDRVKTYNTNVSGNYSDVVYEEREGW
jgi:hypothetical protein